MTNAFNAWLRQLASTNFKIVIGAVLAAGTALFYFSSEIRCAPQVTVRHCRPIDATNFALWLAFVASWAGITWTQLWRRRDGGTASSREPVQGER